ncbi:Sterol regulatory element-binding protein cleavage-activating protein [Colletotrichum chlorophyti]|uniref:Sterol regulatory element-binding protein cleavage-activating protein n=1 Tax=Colletotrichum chlorophyti TaxID=708187 RepID=A0A1Q8RJD6_9PEZI|nr:Sterol regulatory element-binding protein cleavage-activating protein [Colletotrichum chlorophyti]
MIWYLLYPLRGTTEAPVLAPNHPLRRAFARYGRYAARHVVTTLIISVAVAAILIYPFPYLYTSDLSNGASNLPHHVWTAAQPLKENSTEPDVIMRSIWVHGSYMKALDRDILLGALELQDELLGPTKDFSPRRPVTTLRLHDPHADLAPRDRDAYHVVNGLTSQAWFFHSPLQYWSGSSERILADSDILATVNAKKTQPTSVNVTLRHSIVFSGKRFEDRRLLAADALVITLVHLRDSPVGRQWERKAEALAARMRDKWTAYPADGKSMSSQLYEFQFMPISVQDTVILALAYGLVSVYFLFSLSKLRAVKSKFGLIVTVFVQIVVSIMSSFTVCAIFRVDLSGIPQAAYPVVVLSMSLENIFRLINAVILTPSENSTSSRISRAFGETAHVALASSAQNVLILWGMSKIVSPGVSAFCTFVAVAIVFDFFYLSTFFLAVLSVDVRRTELSDALAKASLKNYRYGQEQPLKRSWLEAMLQGKIALSTRIAGTVIMITFVLIAQWHFFENDTVARLVRGLFRISRDTVGFTQPTKNSILVDIHQARSPTSWLRLQDHESAREVINVIKPKSHSYVARVYDPLVFVLNGADRTPHVPERPLLPALYDFLDHHLKHFLVTVLFIVSAVRLLMNYLLWGDDAESRRNDDIGDQPLLTIESLPEAHSLDVVLMSSSYDGHIISVGLDREVRVWDVRSGVRDYSLAEIESPPGDPFPILAMATDKRSNWLALLSSHRVFLWNLLEHRWGQSVPVELNGQKPEGFFFGAPAFNFSSPLVIVRRNGTMTQIIPGLRESKEFTICKSPLISVRPLMQKTALQGPPQLSILTASRKGCIHVATHKEDKSWVSQSLDLHSAEDRDAHQVVPLSALGSFLVARSQTVDLVDAKTQSLLHTFETEPIQPRSLRCFHSSRRKPQCGSVGLGSFGIAYNHAETGDCVVQTYTCREEGTVICFRNTGLPPSRNCSLWHDTIETKRQITNPGTWEALPNGFIVGVRRDPYDGGSSSGESSPTTTGGLRRRMYQRLERRPTKYQDNWEVWVASHLGQEEIYETRPLHSEYELGSHLIISALGPMVKVGTASVAVGFGNIIKLITVGHQHFEDLAADGETGETLHIGSRRRKPAAMAHAHTRMKVPSWI